MSEAYRAIIVGDNIVSFVRMHGTRLPTFISHMGWTRRDFQRICEDLEGQVDVADCDKAAAFFNIPVDALTERVSMLPNIFTDGDKKTAGEICAVLNELGVVGSPKQLARWLLQTLQDIRPYEEHGREEVAERILTGRHWLTLDQFDRLMRALSGLAKHLSLPPPTEERLLGQAWPAISPFVRGTATEADFARMEEQKIAILDASLPPETEVSGPEEVNDAGVSEGTVSTGPPDSVIVELATTAASEEAAVSAEVGNGLDHDVPEAVPIPKAALPLPLAPQGTPTTLAPRPVTAVEEPLEEWRSILARVHRAMGNADYKKLEPALIRPMVGQPRDYFDPDSLQDLSLSIIEVGQFQPGIVRIVRGDGGVFLYYEILDGERRWRAVVLGSVAVYKAMVVEIDDEAAPYVIACIANFNREGHTHMELSNAIHRLHTGLKIPMPIIAKMYRISTYWAYDLHRLQNLHPHIKGLLDPRLKQRGQLPITAAIEVSKLETSVQEQLVTRYRSGEVTLRTLRKEAVALAVATGTYIRQREADQPARKLRSLKNTAGALLRTVTDLGLLLAEKGIDDVLRTNSGSVAEISGTLKVASEMLTQCQDRLRSN